jgi:hypothetical protein
MRWSAVAAGVLSCVLAGTTALSAQLGDVARKEAERRKTVKANGKTYTNDNITPDRSSTTAPAPSSSSGSPAASSASDKATDKAGTDKTATDKAAADTADQAAAAKPVSADPAERKKEEAQWRERVKNERDGLERARSFAEALQSRINALNTDFVNRDDPQQRAKIAADRDKALADLESARKEIAERTKKIATIQEEARRAGAPAGWVR